MIFLFFWYSFTKKKSKNVTKEELYTKKEFHMYLLCKSLVIVILEYPFLRYCTIIHVPYRSLNKNLVYSPIINCSPSQKILCQNCNVSFLISIHKNVKELVTLFLFRLQKSICFCISLLTCSPLMHTTSTVFAEQRLNVNQVHN